MLPVGNDVVSRSVNDQEGDGEYTDQEFAEGYASDDNNPFVPTDHDDLPSDLGLANHNSSWHWIWLNPQIPTRLRDRRAQGLRLCWIQLCRSGTRGFEQPEPYGGCSTVYGWCVLRHCIVTLLSSVYKQRLQQG